MREGQVRSLGQEGPLGEEMATHSTVAWRAVVHGVAESDTTWRLSDDTSPVLDPLNNTSVLVTDSNYR